MIMFEEIKQETKVLMGKTIDSLHSTLSKIRAGRPNPSMLDSIEADYFDVKTPLKQLANISVTDAADSVEGFVGLRSFVVLASDDKDTQIVALHAANKALRQELDFIQGTRSWKVTSPLRRWKGRGA